MEQTTLTPIGKFKLELEEKIKEAKREAITWYETYDKSKDIFAKETAERWGAKRRHFILVLDLFEKTVIREE